MRYMIVTVATLLFVLSSSLFGQDDGGGEGGFGGEEGDVEATYWHPPVKITVSDPYSNVDSGGETEQAYFSASRVVGFLYKRGSLKPTRVRLRRVMRGMGMVGDMGMGSDMGMGGMEAMMGGMDGEFVGETTAQLPSKSIMMIYAYVIDEEQIEGRTTIKLVTLPGGKAYGDHSSGMDGMDMGGMDGMDMGSDMGSDMGMMGGMDMMGGQVQPKFKLLGSATNSSTSKGKTNLTNLTQPELKIVSDTIRQTIWKEDAVKLLNESKGDAKTLATILAETEQLLREVLTEEYDTQLARQEIEVKRIEQRIVSLRAEMNRRRAAKERVIDVQLGRIVLESQGLLSR